MLSIPSILSLLGCTATALAQTVYLAGDSTMAKASGATTGWGVYLQYSLKLPVVNKAIGGRSARSFTVENRFDEIINLVKTNDIVIIEFGHNDGGSLAKDNGRTACPGAGNEKCTSNYNGKTVTVLTYPAYLINAGKALSAKGAKVFISSPTPNNPWEGGSFSYAPSRFTTYSKSAAEQIGGQSAMFVDHGQYTANIFKTMGKARVDALFPNDHTHTSPAGADVVNKAFVKALLCGGGGWLKGQIKNSTQGVEGACI